VRRSVALERRRRSAPAVSPVYRFAWRFYLALAALGLVGLALLGRRIDLALFVDPAHWPLELGIGIFAGLALTLAWRLVARVSLRARRVEALLAEAIGPLSGGEVVALALISALGEEVAFRGALQEALGWVPAALAFGLLHVGPRRIFLVWTALALVGGLALGGLVAARGNLAPAIAAHFVFNLIQLARLGVAPRAESGGAEPSS
jgi:membrane protease YdiL (CAAX protease family)